MKFAIGVFTLVVAVAIPGSLASAATHVARLEEEGSAARLALTVPTLDLRAVLNRDAVKLTWSASTPQVEWQRRRLNADGSVDTSRIGNVQATVNDGEHIDNPNPGHYGPSTFQYRVRAKQGDQRSLWTSWRTINNIH